MVGGTVSSGVGSVTGVVVGGTVCSLVGVLVAVVVGGTVSPSVGVVVGGDAVGGGDAAPAETPTVRTPSVRIAMTSVRTTGGRVEIGGSSSWTCLTESVPDPAAPQAPPVPDDRPSASQPFGTVGTADFPSLAHLEENELMPVDDRTRLTCTERWRTRSAPKEQMP